MQHVHASHEEQKTPRRAVPGRPRRRLWRHRHQPAVCLKEVFGGAHHPVPITPDNVLGILSLIFWSLIVVVSLKYVTLHPARRQQGRGRHHGADGAGPAADGDRLRPRAGGHPARPVRRRAVLRRRRDHAGDFGALGGRGPGGGDPGCSSPTSCRSRWASWSACSDPAPRHGQVGALFGPIMVLWFRRWPPGVAQHREQPRGAARAGPWHACAFFRQSAARLLLAGRVVLA
jgi:hypothetical protein